MSQGPDGPRDDSAALEGLGELRDVAPPPAFVASVLRRVVEPRRPSLWNWLRRPRRIELRLSPLGAVAGSLAIALAIYAGAGASLPPRAAVHHLVPGPDQNSTDAPATVQVRFVIEARGAHRVALAGDFNDWRTDDVVLVPVDGVGRFAAIVPLPRGDHEYMFVIDGRWVTDPAAEERRPDGFGRENALLRL
jgi:hypothetical protein